MSAWASRTRTWGVGAAAILAAGVARADGLADVEADKLLKAGQDLFEKGQIHEACDKFDLSLRREHNLNTLALLALCHERENKPGKAWNEFKRAERDAPQGEKAAVVAQHLKALEAKVARARLDVGSRVMREVRVDNEPVILDQGRVVTDPGYHSIVVTVEAAGPLGARTVTRNAKLEQGDNADIVIETGDERGAAPTGESPPGAGTNGRRAAGFVLVGVGVVGLAVGTVVGISVLNTKSQADDLCYPKNPSRSGACDSADAANSAEDKKQQAIVPSWLATASLGIGAVGIGAGIYLLLTAGRSAPSGTAAPRIQPTVGPRSLGLSAVF
jgi:hypothetical protein